MTQDTQGTQGTHSIHVHIQIIGSDPTVVNGFIKSMTKLLNDHTTYEINVENNPNVFTIQLDTHLTHVMMDEMCVPACDQSGDDDVDDDNKYLAGQANNLFHNISHLAHLCGLKAVTL